MSSVQICLPVCLLNCLPAWLPACVSVCLSACLSVCLSACLRNLSKQIENMFEWSPQPPTPLHTRTHYKQCHTHWDTLTTPQTHTHTRAHVEVSDYRLLGQKSDVTDMHETLHRRAWTLFMGCQIRCAVVTETTCLSGLPAIWTYVILLVNDNQYKWLYLKGTQMKLTLYLNTTTTYNH